MKKNFFATLIIVVLTLIMSFTLTSCDLFNRGDGSGSNGGGNGSDEVMEGLDKSKLSALAIADQEAQELALMIGDDYFDALKDLGGLLTREDLANLFAIGFNAPCEDEPYRFYGISGERDGDYYWKGFYANCCMYEVLKAENITIENYYNEAYEDTLSDEIKRQMRVYDEETQREYICGIGFRMEGIRGVGAEITYLRAEIEEMLNDDECKDDIKVFGDEDKLFCAASGEHADYGEFYIVKDDNIWIHAYV